MIKTLRAVTTIAVGCAIPFVAAGCAATVKAQSQAAPSQADTVLAQYGAPLNLTGESDPVPPTPDDRALLDAGLGPVPENEHEFEPDGRFYDSILDLKDDAVAAGLDCAVFANEAISLDYEMLLCADADSEPTAFFAVFDDSQMREELVIEIGTQLEPDTAALVGPNWFITAPAETIDAIQPNLGGEIVTPE